MKKITLIVVLLLVIIGIGFAGLAFVVFTQKGVEMVLDQVLTKKSRDKDVVYETIDGNLINGLTFEKLTLSNLEYLPPEAILKIQRLYLDLTSFGVDGLVVELENARLRLPNLEPIVISGSLKEGQLDVNVYGNDISVNTLVAYLPSLKKIFNQLSVSIKKIDLYFTGEYTSPNIKGEFLIDQARYKGIDLNEAMGVIDLNINDWNNGVNIDGEVVFESGVVRSKRTMVQLEQSSVFFNGDPKNPSLFFSGTSEIDRVHIDINVKGSVNKPDLQLSSEPNLPRARLMLMLATGKKWHDIDGSQDSSVVSQNLTKDFIDYFIFAGKGNRFAEKFGLDAVAVNWDKNTQGVTAQKGVTDKLDVRYGVKQSSSGDNQKDVTQKVGGGISINRYTFG